MFVAEILIAKANAGCWSYLIFRNIQSTETSFSFASCNLMQIFQSEQDIIFPEVMGSPFVLLTWDTDRVNEVSFVSNLRDSHSKCCIVMWSEQQSIYSTPFLRCWPQGVESRFTLIFDKLLTLDQKPNRAEWIQHSWRGKAVGEFWREHFQNWTNRKWNFL